MLRHQLMSLASGSRSMRQDAYLTCTHQQLLQVSLWYNTAFTISHYSPSAIGLLKSNRKRACAYCLMYNGQHKMKMQRIYCLLLERLQTIRELGSRALSNEKIRVAGILVCGAILTLFKDNLGRERELVSPIRLTTH